MSRYDLQSLRQLMTECKDVFMLKLAADPPANVKPLVIELRDGTEPVRMSARKCAPPQLKFMRDKTRDLEELGLVNKISGADEGESSAHPSEARARPVSHDCRSACTKRVN
jgi:hypothetical protein